MRRYVLHVSNPDRDGAPIPLPSPQVGARARYPYDRSIKVARGLLPPSEVYLWGSKKSGMYGLFAAGVCTASDIEPPYRKAKYYDALVEVEHDAVAPAAQGAQQIIEVHPELRDLVERLDSSSMLQLFRIETAQAEALSSILNRAVLE